MAAAAQVHLLRRSDDDIASAIATLAEYRDQGKFCDVSLASNGDIFRCHKNLVAKSSRVLEAMLLADMSEASSNLIKLDHIPSSIVKIIVDYVYTFGEVTVNDDNLMDLIVAADFLQMTSLLHKCLKQIVLTPENVLSYNRLSVRFNLTKLNSQCLAYVKSNFVKIMCESEFASLNMSELVDYLKSVRESVHDEKLQAIFKWTAHDMEGRSGEIVDLLRNVQLENCSLAALIDIMDCYNMLVFSNKIVFEMLTSSLKNLSLSSAGASAAASTSTEKTLVIVGGQVSDTVQRKCWRVSESNQVEELCDIKYEIERRHSVCQSSAGFVITGGEDSKLCVSYDSRHKTWSKCADLTQTRCEHGSVCVNDVVYVMAGGVSGSSSDSVEWMSLEQGKWQRGADLPVSTLFPKVSTLSGNIYLLDWDSDKFLQLNVSSSSRWEERSPCPGSIHDDVSMCPVQGNLWVVGGYHRTCVYYSPATDSWTKAQHQPQLKHMWGSAVEWRQRLMLLGGRHPWSGVGTDETEEMQLSSRTWRKNQITLPEGLCFHHAFVLDIPQ